jgi:phospholipid/cholesterol/gamma-HCH transport system substrate-binding protein
MPDKYKKDLSIEVLVGFFMFIILIALGVFTIILSRQNFMQKKYPVTFSFEEVSGLRVGDTVYLRGMKVGTVKTTAIENDRVMVHADLDVPAHFRQGYKAEVLDSSVLGGKQLSIYEGPLNAPAIPEDAIIYGKSPVNLLDELSETVVRVRQVMDQISSGQGTLGKLIYDDAVYENLRDVSGKMARGEGTLGKLLSDDSVYTDMQTIMTDLQSSVASLKEVTTRLQNGEGTLGKLLSEDDQLYQDISASAANLRAVIGKIGSGEGTLGKLVNDDEIYVEAQKLLVELRAAIDDMRETSPVTTFSTIFFGAF